MKLVHVTWKGGSVDDPALMQELPGQLGALLDSLNGFIQFHGGLHVRGLVRAPKWHSLREAWRGRDAVHRRYDAVQETDIPFAEDYAGNQFLLRRESVIELDGETGELTPLGMDLAAFLEAVQNDPVGVLELEPLLAFQESGGRLGPGELLAIYPPLCSEEAEDGVECAAVPAAERYAFLKKLADFVGTLPPGQAFRVQTQD